MDPNDITAAQIRAARAALSWTQGDLADMAGMTRKTLAAVEDETLSSSLSSRVRVIDCLISAGIEFTVSDGRPSLILPTA